MKYDFKYHAKTAGITIGEVAVLGAGMLVTKKFLDFNTLFKNKIAADPTYAEKWFIKHQGAVKLVISVLVASHIKNPWIKIAVLGIGVEGFITEVRTLSTDANGVSFFDKIGANPTMRSLPIDQELDELAKQYDDNLGFVNPATEYNSSVAGTNPATQYTSSVAGGAVIDLTDSIDMTTNGPGWGQFQEVRDWAA